MRCAQRPQNICTPLTVTGNAFDVSTHQLRQPEEKVEIHMKGSKICYISRIKRSIFNFTVDSCTTDEVLEHAS